GRRSARAAGRRGGGDPAPPAGASAGRGGRRASPRGAPPRNPSRWVSDEYRRKNRETVVQNALYFPFVDLLSTIATAVVLGYGGYLVFQGGTTIGGLAAYLRYLTNFFYPGAQRSRLYRPFLSGGGARRNIHEGVV